MPEVDLLIDEETLKNRVAEMGRRITEDYRGKAPTVLVVLKGSFIFASDLLRKIDMPLTVEFIGLRSYGSRKETSGVVEITMDTKHPLSGQDVLIIEDIVDTGLTISYLKKNIATRMPNSVKLACLLHKPARTIVETPIDYLGFTIPDRFVIGYGLDKSGFGRNLPYICAIRARPSRQTDGSI